MVLNERELQCWPWHTPFERVSEREPRSPLNWNPLSLHHERRGSPFPVDVVLCETQSQVVWNTPCHLIRYMIRYYSPIMLMNGSMTKTCQPNKHVRMNNEHFRVSNYVKFEWTFDSLHHMFLHSRYLSPFYLSISHYIVQYNSITSITPFFSLLLSLSSPEFSFFFLELKHLLCGNRRFAYPGLCSTNQIESQSWGKEVNILDEIDLFIINFRSPIGMNKWMKMIYHVQKKWGREKWRIA